MPLDINARFVGLEKSAEMAAKKAGRNLKINLGTSGKDIKSLEQPLGRITGKADEFTKSMEAANARVLAFGASVGIINSVVQSFKSLVSTTIEVEANLAKINSILKTTTSGLSQLKGQIFDIARNTEQTFDTVAEAALELSRQGLSATEVTKRLNDALILSRLSGISAAEAVAGLTAAVNSFSKAGLTTGEVLNKISNAANQFAVSERDLIEGFKRSASVAEQAGVSIDELGGIITAVQQKTARGGAVIGNSFKTIFTRIGRAENLELLRNIGVDITDVQGKILPATKLIENLAKQLEKLDDVQVRSVTEKIGGGFQIAPLLAAISDYSSETSIAIKATEAFRTATDQAYQKNIVLNQTLSAAINTTTLSVKELANTLGELGVTDTFKEILNFFNNFAQKAQDILDGEGFGSSFARSIVKGLSNVLLKGGIALFAVLIIKLTGQLAKFGLDSLKTFLNIGKEANRIKAIQDQIVTTLLSDKGVRNDILKIENSSLSAEQKRLQQAQYFNAALKERAALNKQITGIGRGVAPRINGASGYVPSAASGYLPLQEERSDIAKGVGGAPKGAKPVVLRDFKFGGGRRGTMVANDSEYIVPNYAAGGDAIFNQDMVRSLSLPNNAKKIGGASRGYIPNFIEVAGMSASRENITPGLSLPSNQRALAGAKGYTPNFARGGLGVYDSDFLTGKDKASVLNTVLTSGKMVNVLVAPAGAGKTSAVSKRGGQIIKSQDEAKMFAKYLVLSAAGRTKAGGFSPQFQKIAGAAKASGGKVEYLYVPNLEIKNRRNKRLTEGALDPRSRRALIGTTKAPTNQFDFIQGLKRSYGGQIVRSAGGYIPNFALNTADEKRFGLWLKDNYPEAVDSSGRWSTSKAKNVLGLDSVFQAKVENLYKNPKLKSAYQGGLDRTGQLIANTRLKQKAALGKTGQKSKYGVIFPDASGGAQATPIQVGSNAGVDYSALAIPVTTEVPSALFREIRDQMVNSAESYVTKIGFKDSFLNKQKFSDRVDASINEGTVAGAFGTVFDAAITGALGTTRSANARWDLASPTEIQKLFTNLKKGSPLQKSEGLASELSKADFKNSLSLDNKRSLLGKILSAEGVAAEVKPSSKRAANGYVPNFAKKEIRAQAESVGQITKRRPRLVGRINTINDQYKKERKSRSGIIQAKDVIQPPIIRIQELDIKKYEGLIRKKYEGQKAKADAEAEIERLATREGLRKGQLTSTEGSGVAYGSTASLDAINTVVGEKLAREVKSGKYSEQNIIDKFLSFPLENANKNNQIYKAIFNRKFTEQAGETIQYKRTVRADLAAFDQKKLADFNKKLKSENAARGYVPNYAMSPLEDAIQREKQAGIPVNQIRINQDGKLRNSQNPGGLAVTNTRDEPTGRIPNFVKTPLSTASLEGFGITNNALKALSPQLKEINKLFDELSEKLKSGKISQQEANDVVDKFADKIQSTTKGVGGATSSKLKEGLKEKLPEAKEKEEEKATGDATGKLFALSTAAFTLSSVFGAVGEEAEGSSKKMAEFAQGLSSTITTLTLFQGLGANIGPGAGFLGGVGKSGKLAGAASKGFGKVIAGVTKAIGFLGKGIGAAIPFVGQLVIALQAVDAVGKLFGKDLFKTLKQQLGLIKTPFQEASEATVEFSKTLIDKVGELNALQIGQSAVKQAVEAAAKEAAKARAEKEGREFDEEKDIPRLRTTAFRQVTSEDRTLRFDRDRVGFNPRGGRRFAGKDVSKDVTNAINDLFKAEEDIVAAQIGALIDPKQLKAAEDKGDIAAIQKLFEQAKSQFSEAELQKIANATERAAEGAFKGGVDGQRAVAKARQEIADITAAKQKELNILTAEELKEVQEVNKVKEKTARILADIAFEEKTILASRKTALEFELELQNSLKSTSDLERDINEDRLRNLAEERKARVALAKKARETLLGDKRFQQGFQLDPNKEINKDELEAFNKTVENLYNRILNGEEITGEQLLKNLNLNKKILGEKSDIVDNVVLELNALKQRLGLERESLSLEQSRARVKELTAKAEETRLRSQQNILKFASSEVERKIQALDLDRSIAIEREKQNRVRGSFGQFGQQQRITDINKRFDADRDSLLRQQNSLELIKNVVGELKNQSVKLDASDINNLKNALIGEGGNISEFKKAATELLKQQKIQEAKILVKEQLNIAKQTTIASINDLTAKLNEGASKQQLEAAKLQLEAARANAIAIREALPTSGTAEWAALDTDQRNEIFDQRTALYNSIQSMTKSIDNISGFLEKSGATAEDQKVLLDRLKEVNEKFKQQLQDEGFANASDLFADNIQTLFDAKLAIADAIKSGNKGDIEAAQARYAETIKKGNAELEKLGVKSITFESFLGGLGDFDEFLQIYLSKNTEITKKNTIRQLEYGNALDDSKASLATFNNLLADIFANIRERRAKNLFGIATSADTGQIQQDLRNQALESLRSAGIQSGLTQADAEAAAQERLLLQQKEIDLIRAKDTASRNQIEREYAKNVEILALRQEIFKIAQLEGQAGTEKILNLEREIELIKQREATLSEKFGDLRVNGEDSINALENQIVGGAKTFVDTISDGLVDAIVLGNDLGDTLRSAAFDFFNELAKTSLKNVFNTIFFGSAGPGKTGAGGLLGGLLGSLGLGGESPQSAVTDEISKRGATTGNPLYVSVTNLQGLGGLSGLGAGNAGGGALGAGSFGGGSIIGTVLRNTLGRIPFIGGFFQGFAGGGEVRGGSGYKDDIPAMLMDGEYVIKKDSVKKLGKGFLDKINKGKIPKFARGGLVEEEEKFQSGEGGFFAPGAGFGGTIRGKGDLLRFAGQAATSGAQDVIGSGTEQFGGGGASFINLEPESVRLTNFGRNQGNPLQLATQAAKEQGFGLYVQQLDLEEQLREQEKARKKAIKNALISAVVGSVLSYGLNKFNAGGTNAVNQTIAQQGPEVFKGFGGALKKFGTYVKGGVGFGGQLQLPGGGFTAQSYGGLLNTGGRGIIGQNNLGSFLKNQSLRPGSTISQDAFNYFGGPTAPKAIELKDQIYGRFATGGQVPYAAGVDTVPAMLSGGEFIVNSGAADRFGRSNLEGINAGISGISGDNETTGELIQKLDELIDATKESTGEINITVNEGSSEGGGKDGEEKQERGDSSAEKRRLATKLKEEVLKIIAEERRIGGSLRGGKL